MQGVRKLLRPVKAEEECGGESGFSALRSLKKITNEKDKPETKEIGSLQGVGLTRVIK